MSYEIQRTRTREWETKTEQDWRGTGTELEVELEGTGTELEVELEGNWNKIGGGNWSWIGGEQNWR